MAETAPPSKLVKWSDMDAVADAIVAALAAVTAPLQARVAELEARPALKYCGVFDDSTIYHAGNLVTRSGSLWLAERDTAAHRGRTRPAGTSWSNAGTDERRR